MIKPIRAMKDQMVEITCENRNVKRPIDLKEIKETAGKVLHYLGKRGFGLNIVFVSNQKIRALNRKYLARDNATDVIAFQEEDSIVGGWKEPTFLGDIAISSDKAKQNAVEYGLSFENEIILYVVHGILHLVGYEDKTKKGKILMKREENEIFRKIRTNTRR